MFTRMTSLLVLAFLLLQGTTVLAAPSSQTSQTQDKVGGWRMAGRVLDTGVRSDEVFDTFTAASIQSGYPIYLLVISEQLLVDNPTASTAMLADDILAGEFEKQFGLGQAAGGFFPDEVIVLVVAPYIQKPNVSSDLIDASHPWKRAATDLAATGRYAKINEMKNAEHTYAFSAVQGIDRMLVEEGLHTAPAVWAVGALTKAFAAIEVYPDGMAPLEKSEPQKIIIPTPQIASSATKPETDVQNTVPKRPVQQPFPWGLVSVLFFAVVAGYSYLLLWPSYVFFKQAKTEADDFSADWTETRVLDAEIAVTNILDLTSQSTIDDLQRKINVAKQDGMKLQGDYNKVMRPIKAAWWIPLLLHWGYAAQTRKIEVGLLKGFREANAELEAVKKSCAEIKEDHNAYLELEPKVTATHTAAQAAVEETEKQGFASRLIETALLNVSTLKEEATAKAAAKDFETALQFAQQAIAAAEVVESDAHAWPDRVRAMPLELYKLSERLEAVIAETSPNKLLSKLKQAYASSCWQQVARHPDAIEKIFAELRAQIAQAKQELTHGHPDYDKVASDIAEVEAGLAKVESLIKSVTELDEDLAETAQELTKNAPGLLIKVEDLLTLVQTHDPDVDETIEDQLQSAFRLLQSVIATLRGSKPDVMRAENDYNEAKQTYEGVKAKPANQIEAMAEARQNASQNVASVKRGLSALLNFMEDHEKEIGIRAQELAEEARGTYEKAVELFNEAEQMPDGVESKRLEAYKQAASLAAEAKDTLEEAQEVAEDDVEPDQPVATSYGGYSGSYSTYTPGTNLPIWRSPVQVVVTQPQPMHRATAFTASRPVVTHTSAVRNYTPPARPVVTHTSAVR